MFDKNDKWVLASHLQKAIRRGWGDEAAWAAEQLVQVDRAYLAYRLSVIAVEDVGAGDLEVVGQFVSEEQKWGARRFNTSKSDEDTEQWKQVATTFANAIKDRTPCEWMACVYWLNEFERQEGPWAQLNPTECIAKAYEQDKPWWWRGLMAWRAAGTDKFPSSILPELPGCWEDWKAHAPTETLTILEGFGERQREAHPVFFPLAVFERFNDANSKVMSYDCGDILKSGPWLSAALDKHTSEGNKAIGQFLRQVPKPVQDQLKSVVGYDGMNDVVGRLMFWMEGGKVNRAQHYQLASQISHDIKAKWLSQTGLSGRWLLEHFGKPDQWHEARTSIARRLEQQRHSMP